MTTDRRGGGTGLPVRDLVVLILAGAVLAYFAFGSYGHGCIKDAQASTAVQMAHQLGVVEFAYAEDHNGIYPSGSSGHAIANKLLNEGYANNPSLFCLRGTPGHTQYTGSAAPYDLTEANCIWDFWVSDSNGLPKGANDLTPVCQMTAGNAITGLPTTAGTGITLTIDPRRTAFGPKGIPVYYMGNNAEFIKCTPVDSTKAVNLPTENVPYVGPLYADPQGASYHSVLP